MDRIDIHLEVPRIEYDKLADRRPGETSEKVGDRVTEARERQAAPSPTCPERITSKRRILLNSCSTGRGSEGRRPEMGTSQPTRGFVLHALHLDA